MLISIGCVSQHPVFGKTAHVEYQVAVFKLSSQYRWSIKIDIKLKKSDFRGNWELFINFPEQQVNLQKSKQFGCNFTVHIKHCQRCQQLLCIIRRFKLIFKIHDQLTDPHPAISVWIKEIKFNLCKDTTTDSGPGYPKI